MAFSLTDIKNEPTFFEHIQDQGEGEEAEVAER